MFDAYLVCKLLKSLYGLKQAPRIWYETLNKALNAISLQRLESNNSVFGKMKSRRIHDIIYVGSILIISVHVNDIFIIGFPKVIKTFKEALKKIQD
jgi:hypothetical protein